MGLSGVEEHKRDQEPPDATIAVQKRVDGLELHLGERGFDERRQAVVRGMDEALERGHAMLDVLRRGRNEAGGAGASAADPVLAAAELAGLPVSAAPAR